MAKLPPPPDTIAESIDAAHEASRDEPRPYLGYSLLGHHCDRWLWFTYRWAVIERFSGRMLRLFRRGHREEETVVEDLRRIGCVVTKCLDEQEPMGEGAVRSGGCDGIIESGLPGAEKTRHVLEIKTHSAKSFSVFIGTEKTPPKDVLEAKPQHWVQMQLAMGWHNIDRALYVAVCKDDDRIYTERVRFEAGAALMALQIGKRIASAERIPEPTQGASPTWYKCKMCPAYSMCHEIAPTQEVNCRTCAHSTPAADCTWTCARWGGVEIPEEQQRRGCESHVLHPDMVPWTLDANASSATEAVYTIDGEPVRNGEGDAFVLSSRELVEKWKERHG